MEPMIDPASSIPELIAFIRYSFLQCEFDEVRNILMEREKNMKADLENAVGDREELTKQVDFLEKCKGYKELEKCHLKEKLGRSERRVEELQKMTVLEKEIFEQLRREKEGLEEKLLRSSKKCEELDDVIANWKLKFKKLRSEKVDVEEKLVRSSEKTEEMKIRLVEMERKIEELRRESLSANKTIEELKAKEIEADGVVQELQRKNVEAVQTIDELRAKKMRSDMAVEYYENDLNPRILKLEKAIAKMLSVNVEDLANLAMEGFAAAATDAGEEENLENVKVNSDAEDRVIASTEVLAISGSHMNLAAMQSGGEVPKEKTVVPSTSTIGNVVIILSDSDIEDETTSLPNRVEERAATPQKSHTIDCVDSTDLDGEWSSDAYMNNLVARGQSKKERSKRMNDPREEQGKELQVCTKERGETQIVEQPHPKRIKRTTTRRKREYI